MFVNTNTDNITLKNIINIIAFDLNAVFICGLRHFFLRTLIDGRIYIKTC